MPTIRRCHSDNTRRASLGVCDVRPEKLTRGLSHPRPNKNPRNSRSEQSGWQVVSGRKKTASIKAPRTSKKMPEPEIFRDVKGGNIYSVRAVLQRGEFDVNFFFAGRTVLHWAAQRGNAKMVTWLLEYKADITLRAKHRGTGSGFTALDFAAQAPGKPETVARLLMAEVRL